MNHPPLLLFLLIVFSCCFAAPQSACARSFGSMQKSLEPSKVITYKQIGERKLNLHIFHPEGFKTSDQRPAYIVFHGGAWRSGNPRRFYPYAASLVPDGFVGISAGYRLTRRDKTTVFDCVKDGRAAIRYIRRHAKDLGIDPDRITVGGGSAGGHVALGTALFDTVEHADEDLKVSCKPDALVLLFSVLDTSPEGYGNKVIGAEWRKISPLHQIRPKMPPTLIFHGDKDSVAPYPTLMAFYKKMKDNRNVCELVLQPGGVHGHINNDIKLFDDAAKQTKMFLTEQQLGLSTPQKGKNAASLPKVLILGDSISGGYSKSLTKLLDGKATVTKLGAVAGYRIQTDSVWHSSGKSKNLMVGSAKACIADFDRIERHLSETQYDVIHFNFGLNDIFRGRKGAWHNPVDQYAKDLEKIVTLLKKNGAKVIWANTTPIPDNDDVRPKGDDLIYNAAAAKVMKKNNIPINNLHSIVTNWDGYAKWKKGNNVHFSGGVSSKLAEQIAEKILEQLETPGKTNEMGLNPINSPSASIASAEVNMHQQAYVKVGSLAGAKDYDPMIFGGFIEHLGKQIYGGFFEPGSPLANKKGFRLDVIEAIKELKVAVIRWPGGCFVDSYHWKKGVGKVRQPYDDDRWGVLEPNTFGTHEFIELCRLIGAEPYICQNSLASIQEMADWVAYCNSKTGKLAEMRKKNGHPEPFNVKFWSVGNEKGGNKYIDKVRDTAVAMKQVDPSILVTCSGAHGPDAYINPYLFPTAGKHLNLLSIHEYWIPNYKKHHTPDYLACMMLSEKPDAHLDTVIKSLNKAGMRGRLKIAFDEWNLRSWHHPGFSGHHPRKVDYNDPEVIALIKARDKSLNPALYTMSDALFCASFFNACFRNTDDVTMANIACLVNQTGPLYVHPKGLVKRTHFHTMSMYANLLKERVAKTEVTSGKLTDGKKSVAVVDAVATTDKAGKSWAVSLVNRHPSNPVACTVKMGNTLLDGVYEATILTGESADSYNDMGHPDRVAPKKIKLQFKKGVTDLPPHSLIIVEGKI